MSRYNQKPYVSAADKRRKLQDKCGLAIIAASMICGAAFVYLSANAANLTAAIVSGAVMVVSGMVATLALCIGHSA